MKSVTEGVFELPGLSLRFYTDEEGHKWFAQSDVSSIISLADNDYYYYIRSNAVDPDVYAEHRKKDQMHVKGTRKRITPVSFLSAVMYWKYNAEKKNNGTAEFLYRQMKNVTSY